MKTTRLQYIAIRAAVFAAIAVGTTSVAGAQKAKPTGPPLVTNGTVKSNPKADKGQATAEAARLEAREEKAERAEMKLARQEPKSALKGIKLTDAQKASSKDIEQKYATQYKALAKTEKAGDKAGTIDAQFLNKIDALRLQERAELRNTLTPEQQVDFDMNIAAIEIKKMLD